MTRSSKGSSELLDRIPPHCLDSERGVIGSLLLDPRLAADVATVVRPDDFHVDAHRKLYGHLLAMHNGGRAIDTALLVAALKAAGDWEAVGGAATIADIVHAVPVSSNAVHYAGIVREKAQRRNLIQLGMATIQNAWDPCCEVAQALGAAEAGLMACQTGSAADMPRPWIEVVGEVMQQAELAMERGHGGGVMTGFEEFDRSHGGFWPGELVVIGARPSMGKTALVMQVAAWVARGGLVYVASLEMRATELALRAVCSEAGLTSSVVRTGSLTDDQLGRLSEASNIVSRVTFLVHDRPDQSVADIRSQARRLNPKGLRMVVVDYLQLMRPSDEKAGRVEQFSVMTRSLKLLARELDVPVVILSQLNRQGDDGRPILRHLRDSGSIEQDADVVWLLWRPKGGITSEKGETPDRWDGEIEVAKARNGPPVTMKLDWDPTRLRFAERQRRGFGEFDQFSGRRDFP